MQRPTDSNELGGVAMRVLVACEFSGVVRGGKAVRP
jgi:hypothetical protein